MKVSVCVITYNHAPYIRRCLDSLIMQQTDFPYEIIVNDDCSTDGTTDILREYEAKHPGLVKPIYHDENQVQKGIYQIFSTFTFPKAQGEYIAMCEGDDYWLDPLKLQKQADFLDAHPTHSMVFHAVRWSYNDGTIQDTHRYDNNMDVCPIEDMINYGFGFCNLNSLMINRQRYGNGFSKWLTETYVEDSPMVLHCYSTGKVGYINDVMSIYCYALPGSWSSSQQRSLRTRLFTLTQRITIFRAFDRWTNSKFHPAIKKQIRRGYKQALLVELRIIKRKLTSKFI